MGDPQEEDGRGCTGPQDDGGRTSPTEGIEAPERPTDKEIQDFIEIHAKVILEVVREALQARGVPELVIGATIADVCSDVTETVRKDHTGMTWEAWAKVQNWIEYDILKEIEDEGSAEEHREAVEAFRASIVGRARKGEEGCDDCPHREPCDDAREAHRGAQQESVDEGRKLFFPNPPKLPNEKWRPSTSHDGTGDELIL